MIHTIYTHIYVCVCVRAHVCVRVRACVCVYTHTHTFIYKSKIYITQRSRIIKAKANQQFRTASTISTDAWNAARCTLDILEIYSRLVEKETNIMCDSWDVSTLQIKM